MSDFADMMQTGVPLDQAAVVCVVVHGRGQSPALMQEQMVARLKTQATCFLLPKAQTGSWYDARAVDPLSTHSRLQLQQSLKVVEAAMVHAHKAGKPVALVGFSQGACLSMEYAFAHGRWTGALVCLTGCRVGSDSDERPRAALQGLPVYLSGSDADPWIPVSAFATAAGELAKAGARLRCDVMPGRPHEISDTEIRMLDEILAAQASTTGQPWL